ncbi:MAG: hypothetical protein WC745_05050 [Patescibacteria group bacterium]
MSAAKQREFAPPNPDKEKQELTPGECFAIDGRRYTAIDKPSLETLSGKFPNALAEDGKLYNFNEAEKVQPGALYYDQERNKYFLRVNSDFAREDGKEKEFNAVENNSGTLVCIDPESEREPVNNDWLQGY